MPSLIPLDDYTGAALIGLLLSGMCVLSVSVLSHRHPLASLSVYGITLLQVYSYFVDHPETDGQVLKLFVCSPFRGQDVH
jgi:hypothetical protein